MFYHVLLPHPLNLKKKIYCGLMFVFVLYRCNITILCSFFLWTRFKFWCVLRVSHCWVLLDSHTYSLISCRPMCLLAKNDDDGAPPNGHLANGHRKNPRAAGTANPAEQSGSNKDAKAGHGTAPAFEHRQEIELDGLPCVVKVYDFREGLLKLNDTVEFVGILAYDQPDSSQEDSQAAAAMAAGWERGATTAGAMDTFKAMEDFSRKVPPPSLAPRLHCICE